MTDTINMKLMIIDVNLLPQHFNTLQPNTLRPIDLGVLYTPHFSMLNMAGDI